MSRARLIVGSAHWLPEIAAGSVHLVATSPPYWGLRLYAGDQRVHWPAGAFAPMPSLPEIAVPAWRGALGAEPTPEMYIWHLVLCAREWRRVLRDDGVCFVNLGDSYTSGGRGDYGPTHGRMNVAVKSAGRPPQPSGLKPKDLTLIPARLALALQADGWYVRSEIIWHKPNAMPEAVRDRPTRAHETIWLLAKSERYFWDAEAIREPVATPGRSSGNVERRVGDGRRGRPNTHLGYGVPWQDDGRGRNARSVWSISTRPYRGAHFATWPPEIVARMIQAGTSAAGCCPRCGAPYRRIVERRRTLDGRPADLGSWRNQSQACPSAAQGVGHWRTGTEAATLGWQPGCDCAAGDPEPCRVLDPFSGSGTTGMVAVQMGRDYIGVDIAEPYQLELAPARIGGPAGVVTQENALELL